MEEAILPGLPVRLIRECYAAAPGKEIERGNFSNPESSAVLVANTFGLFLDRAKDLPPFPVSVAADWPPLSVRLEAEVRFPWRGGRHPWLDVLAYTSGALIGVESKRYEPFRSREKIDFSEAYWRPVWGEAMARYERVRDGLHNGELSFEHVDAEQLVKHAFGLRTAVHRRDSRHGKQPVLLYLYAEPATWPDGRPVSADDRATHHSEVTRFAAMVDGDEVNFQACSYRKLLDGWRSSPLADVRDHAAAVQQRFAP